MRLVLLEKIGDLWYNNYGGGFYAFLNWAVR